MHTVCMPAPKAKKTNSSPEAQLDSFIDKFTPEMAALARACLAKMRARLPGATQLVYDNYNALVVGFGPSEKTSHAIFSVAMYPRWVNLFFLQAAPKLPDPNRLLKGSGNVVRSITIQSASQLDQPAVQALIAAAFKRAIQPIDPATPGQLVIRSISAKQRPRRPKR
jgi:hypothetical protein